MFIATATKTKRSSSGGAKQSRSQLSALLRSSGNLKSPAVYKHFIPTGCVHETLLKELDPSWHGFPQTSRLRDTITQLNYSISCLC